MLTVVIIMNMLIAGFCFFVAWRIWRLRRALVRVTHALVAAERSTHWVLYGAPEAIQRGELGIEKFQQAYHQLELQLHRAQQALALLSLGQIIWRRRSLWSKRQSTRTARTSSQSISQINRLNPRD
jgi:hypothetical protein